ncbi:MAG: 16S rRNA (adenine(1518)-N(6)/adenine(1519)-N(6))-dimethyltransferase RsmA [Chloroflexi bacterium]|nr:16S rRNA (adenine(1518)-N(6)/adenine(1519)-N(6))-dimethyltransferase RsmA [Chloroflexota bacterium]
MPETSTSDTPPVFARKSLGQHFLVDQGALRRVISAADIQPTDVVVEVGPGTGLLTRLLVERAAKVIAVEMDQSLVARLKNDLGGFTNLTIVHGDAREWDPAAVGEPYKLVANLPYYAATPIVRRFLECSLPPSIIAVTVQREVARSMTAIPGKMRTLSVATQLYGKPRIMGYIQPRSFRPPPKVTSAIIRIDVFEKPALSLDDTDAFFRVVRAGFSSARKQLRNPLSHSFGVTGARMEEVLLEAGVDPRLRAEALSLEDWKKLYDAFRSQGLC